ncbi:MAG: hypothetical protein AB9866_13225 [Syntrophobacteraceae bacterium]
MRVRLVLVALALLISLATGAVAQAELYRVYFDVRTHRDYANNTTLTDSMGFWVKVYDTEFKNPPSFVESITVTAPDGKKFPITSVAHWNYLDKGYWAAFPASDFVDGFPAGTYKVQVVAGGSTITAYDKLTPVVFLDPVTMTYPTEGKTGVPEEPLIKWNPVPKASRYMIQLWNTSRSEPLFNWWWPNIETISTNKTSFKIPQGVLKPNNNYRIRIEARADLQDVESRSRSKWINFTTGSW